MPTHIALLRAVNVGGTGKLPMAGLRAMAGQIGFDNPRTYIASGNLVFESAMTADEARAALEAEATRRSEQSHPLPTDQLGAIQAAASAAVVHARAHVANC